MKGGCACGAVRYELSGTPMWVNCCHCRLCQRQTGSAFVLNAVIETGRIQLLAGHLVPTAMQTGSGRPHDIYRCPACHTALWSDYGHRRGLRFLRIGTLDDPGALAPDIHVFTSTRAPWVMLPGDVPAVDAYYDPHAVWPAESLARLRAATQA